MSKGVASLFAEYFEVNHLVDQPEESSLLTERLKNLEEKVSSLPSSSDSELQVRVSDLLTQVEALTQRVKVLEESKPLFVLPSETSASDSIAGSIEVKTESEQPSELLVDFQEEESDLPPEPPSEILPVSGNKLSAIRFKLSANAVAGVKKDFKSSPEKFIEWSRKKDPDGIAWIYVDTPTKGYLPAEELPSELKSKLLKWIAKNI